MQAGSMLSRLSEDIKLQEQIEERRKILDSRRIESKEKAMHAPEAPKRTNQEKELAGYMARREHTRHGVLHGEQAQTGRQDNAGGPDTAGKTQDDEEREIR